MSIGNWLYCKRKFKLIVLRRLSLKSNNKNLIALTYERNWELPPGWNVKYFDINSKLTFINSPDLVIEREFNDGKAEYELLYKYGLEKTFPKVFWFIDAHVASKDRIKYCDNFDYVFVAQSAYIERVKKSTTCKNIFWLPLCFPGSTTEIKKNTSLVKYPVSFIGRYGHGYEKRNEMIDFMKTEYKEFFFVTTNYDGAKSLIQQSKVTTNQSVKDDLNYRVFETLAYGVELVTNHVPDLDKIEGLKEQLYSFNDFSELKKHIDMILNDSTTQKHDMEKVQKWIKQNHSMKNRLSEMLQMINTGKQIEYK